MPLFADQARLTLAGWDAALLAPVLASAETAPEVLDYFLSPKNLRPSLLPALLENPAAGEARLARLVAALPARELALIRNSQRVRSLPLVMQALLGRPEMAGAEAAELRAELAKPAADGDSPETPDGARAEANVEVVGKAECATPASVRTEPDGDPGGEPGEDAADPERAYWREHGAEISAAEGGGFQLIGPTRDEQAEMAAAHAAHASSLAARALAAGPRERPSPIQKICRMTVGERVQLALKGTREERLILVRDGVKVVSNAVLQSPRVSEQDVEMYASMRNVGENVLRGIAANRKFMRRYAVKRLLTANPRCPIEVALPLVKELLVSDLENLWKNRNVPDTVRRFSWKMLRSKRDKKD
jgi:hypothetical protein